MARSSGSLDIVSTVLDWVGVPLAWQARSSSSAGPEVHLLGPVATNPVTGRPHSEWPVAGWWQRRRLHLPGVSTAAGSRGRSSWRTGLESAGLGQLVGLAAAAAEVASSAVVGVRIPLRPSARTTDWT